MSVPDGFPSDRPSLRGDLLLRLRTLVGASHGVVPLLRDRVGPANTQLLHPVSQRRSLHAQARGRATLSSDHPVGGFQRTKDMIPLNFCETIYGNIGFLWRPEWLQLRNRST